VNSGIKNRALFGACIHSCMHTHSCNQTQASLRLSRVQRPALFCSIQSKCNHGIHSPLRSLNLSASPSQICTSHLAECEQVKSSANSSSTCLVISDSAHNIPNLSHKSHTHILPSDIYLHIQVTFISKLLQHFFNFYSSQFHSPQQERPRLSHMTAILRFQLILVLTG